MGKQEKLKKDPFIFADIVGRDKQVLKTGQSAKIDCPFKVADKMPFVFWGC